MPMMRLNREARRATAMTMAMATLLMLGVQHDAMTPVQAAEPERPDAGRVLGQEVVCRGEGAEVRRHQLDRAMMQFRANAIARGETIPESELAELEALILDRLVVTQLLMNQATTEERERGRALADKFVAETIEEAGGEAAFERQLLAMSFTREEFERQIRERAICEEVVERELRSRVKITEDQVRAYYDEHADQLQRPEMVRASHILLATRDPLTGQELGEPEREAKRRRALDLLERARKGEDFGALAREHSEDPGSREQGGEYIFARGQMVPEFETAAFSLRVDQISDLVTTQFGYHIIKLHQRIPAEQIEFARVEEDIRESLERREVQENLLPAYFDRLRKEAKLEYLNGGRPPPDPERRPARE
jgi:peptidyl-prolyl cis-trans isomerase C